MAELSRRETRTTTRWGRSPEHAEEHAAAARLQALYPNMVVWFGETSGHYYAMDESGLRERPTLDALALLAWRLTHRPCPSGPAAGVRTDGEWRREAADELPAMTWELGFA
ncbi:hypothetical protein O4J56_21095 [Nocardiopsis sp. RSe5-2]|uniref:Uncharacterized protein n=1 Tax=Nocardiopsis endophytica TaxID=3018445 RepID=A0ABT4U8W0_9ACTN|nr:hypothetical protein [Nocardiopsis endophytica]MDA2813156.1 hypothetical protein [Nocardiopsis endophytica]